MFYENGPYHLTEDSNASNVSLVDNPYVRAALPGWFPRPAALLLTGGAQAGLGQQRQHDVRTACAVGPSKLPC